MALREYECRFCDETPFVGRRYGWNKENERYEIRLYEARLQVKPDKMFAQRLKSPNGIPILWSHGSWFGEFQAVGRVQEMEFKGRSLVGLVALSEADIGKYVVGGLDTLDDAVNSGLSIGVQFLDNPPVKWKMGKGTHDDPDQMVYQRVQIQEVSLTPVPRIYTAGLIGRGRQAEDPEVTQTENTQ